jgi:hypothetical protein
VLFGLRQLAAALGPVDSLHRSEDKSGSKLPQSKKCNARSSLRLKGSFSRQEEAAWGLDYAPRQTYNA